VKNNISRNFEFVNKLGLCVEVMLSRN